MSIIGIDVGTSGCKVIAFDIDGRVQHQASCPYDEVRNESWREIDPVQVGKQVLLALKKVAMKCKETIEAIAVTSMGESIVCLDKDDHVLYNAMVTGDNRGIDQVKQIQAAMSESDILTITGLCPSEMFTLPKLLWLAQHSPSVFGRIDKIFFFEDYIGYLLTGGERKVSYSSAARSMCFDVHQKKWCESLLSLAGLNSSCFSIPVSPGTIIGTVCPDMVDELHLQTRTIIVAGGHDQCCAVLGGGMTDASIGEDGHGTCEFLSVMLPPNTNEELLGKQFLPKCLYVLPNSYFTGIEITTCGALMNWSRDVLFSDIAKKCAIDDTNFFAYMDKSAEPCMPKALFLPQFGSSGNPDIRYGVTGVIAGLSLHTDAIELYAVLKESLAYQMKMAYDHSTEAGIHLDKLVVTGGGASSAYTAQLRANVFQMPVYRVQCTEAGALGCMILCAVALGYDANVIAGVKRIVRFSAPFLPVKEAYARHEERYQRFRRLYDAMHLYC